MEELRPRNKVAAIFGSYGWGGGAAKEIEDSLRRTDIEIIAPSLTVKWIPDEREIEKCYEFGKDFAKKI